MTVEIVIATVAGDLRIVTHKGCADRRVSPSAFATSGMIYDGATRMTDRQHGRTEIAMAPTIWRMRAAGRKVDGMLGEGRGAQRGAARGEESAGPGALDEGAGRPM